MKRFIVAMTLSLVFIVQLSAQNTGFIGKRFILKVDAVNGTELGFMSAEIEVPVSRKFSINLFGGWHDSRFDLFGPNRTYLTDKEDYGIDKIKTEVKGCEINGWLAGVGFRFYYDKLLPAPLGLYSGMGLGYGRYQVSDYMQRGKVYRFGELDYVAPYQNVEGGAMNIIMFNIHSFGFQHIIAKIFVIDINLSIEGYYADIPPRMATANNNFFATSNIIALKAKKVSIGPSLYVKVGVIF